MLLRIGSVLVVTLGHLSILGLCWESPTDDLYAAWTAALGLLVLGLAGITMGTRQYRGGTASVMGGILAYIALVSAMVFLEDYIRFGEYEAAGLLLIALLSLTAFALLLQGYKHHRMQLLLQSKASKIGTR